MTVYILISALIFVLYIQTGTFMLWKNPQANLNRWFFVLSFYLALYSLGSMLLLNDGIESVYADFIRKSGWGVLFFLFFRFHSVLTGFPKNRLYHDVLVFFFLVFGGGLSLFLYAVMFSFSPERFYLLEDWFWTNQFVDMVYYLVMFVMVVSIGFMYLHWRKGAVWKKEKQRFLVVYLFFVIVGPVTIFMGVLFPEQAVLDFFRMPHVYALPWFVSVSYGFVHYRFLPQDPAKASRKLILELRQLLFFCDQRGIVMETNPFAAQLIGDRINKIRNSHVKDFFVDKQEVVELIQKVSQDEQGGPLQVRLRNSNGEHIPVLLSATLLIDRYGDHYGVALYGKDHREAIDLKKEINRRRNIENSLKSMTGNLMDQVEKQTVDLRRSLDAINLKIAERKSVEETMKLEIADMEIMMGEIHTRIRKNIGIILALLALKKKGGESFGFLKRENTLYQRVNTILLVNNEIHTDDSYGMVNFKNFLKSLMAVYSESWMQKNQIKMELRAVSDFIWVDQAVPLAMVANELINNAVIHAFNGFTEKPPIIKVVFDVKDSERCLFMVRDNGTGFNDKGREGINEYSGLQLAHMLTEEQLSGNFRIETNDGVCATVSFPLYQKRQGHLGINS